MFIKLKLNHKGFAAVPLVISLVVLALIAVAGWFVYQRRNPPVNSFADCVKSGQPVQESYPEVCVSKNGRRFTNPAQPERPAAPNPAKDETSSWLLYTTPDGKYSIRLADGLTMTKSDDGRYLFTYDVVFKPGTKAKIVPLDGGSDGAVGLFVDFQNLGSYTERGTASTFKTTAGLTVTKHTFTQAAPPTELDIPKSYTEHTYLINQSGQLARLTYTAKDNALLSTIEKMVKTITIK